MKSETAMMEQSSDDGRTENRVLLCTYFLRRQLFPAPAFFSSRERGEQGSFSTNKHLARTEIPLSNSLSMMSIVWF